MPYNSTAPQVTLDTTTLENTFGTVGQSMLQLARAQDQTNMISTRTLTTGTNEHASTYRSPPAVSNFHLPKEF